MDSDFVQELLQLENAEQVKQRIREQRDEILQGIADGRVKPDEKLTKYLAELNIAIGDVEVQ